MEKVTNSGIMKILIKLLYDEYSALRRRYRTSISKCGTDKDFQNIVNKFVGGREQQTSKGLLIAPKIFYDMGYVLENLRFRSIVEIQEKQTLESFIRDTIPKDNATLIGVDDIAYGFTLYTGGDAIRTLKRKEENPRVTLKDIVSRYVIGMHDIREEVGQRLRTACASDVLRKSFDTLRVLYEEPKEKYKRLKEALVDETKSSLLEDLDFLYSHYETEKVQRILSLPEEELKTKIEYPSEYFYHGEIICKTQTPSDSLTPPLLVFSPDDPIGSSAEINFLPFYSCSENIQKSASKVVEKGIVPQKKYLFHGDDGFHATVCRFVSYAYDDKSSEVKIEKEELLMPSELGIKPEVKYSAFRTFFQQLLKPNSK